MIFRPILLAILLIFCTTSSVHAQDILLENARLVDPASRSVQQGVIILNGDRIKEVRSERPANFEGEVIDLGGKWVMPGLNDMHVHSYGNMGPSRTAFDMTMTPGTARRMLYVGVTGFLDLFSAEDFIFNLRNGQHEDDQPGADIYAAGPILTAPKGHGTEYGVQTRTMSTPEEAVAHIEELAPKKPDVIKIVYDHQGRMPTINKHTLIATVEAAQAKGIPVVVHIGNWEDVRDVVEAGAEAFTHTPVAPIPEDMIALLSESQTFVIPTLSVQSEFLAISQNPELLDNRLLGEITPAAFLDAYRDSSSYDVRFKGWLRWQASMQEAIFDSIGKLAAAGVPMLTGTDAGNPGVFQGFSLHRELELLVDAGLSTWDALAAATTGPGELLGADIGLEAGDLANLLVLDNSPVEDIRNTQSVYMVIHRGQVIDRSTLIVADAN